MTTEIVEYSKTEAALADLTQKYGGVIFDVTTTDGMKIAKQGRAEIKKYRTSLEELRIAIKAPALRRCQVIDEEATRIKKALLDLETPIDAQIKAEEQRKENERLAAVRAEQERLAAEERARKEAEEAKLAAERAELARQRAELEKEQRERDEQARLAKLRIDEEERASRQRIEDAERKARREREAEEAKAKAAREAEETRIRADREKADAERRAAEDAQRQLREAEEAKEREARRAEEDRQRKEREAKEAIDREERRKETELLDAREMLSTFKRLYGALPQFKGVVKAIDALKEIA